VTSKATKLLQQMRLSKKGWKRKDLEKLYTGMGFTISSGSKHDKVKHPDFPGLIEMLPRHAGEIAPGYVRAAIALIDKVEELKRLANREEGTESNG
jgi:hypothetical protein